MTNVIATTDTDIQKLENMANMLRALAHPTRVALVKLLQLKNELSVTEMYTAINIEQAVASQHLSVLKQKGVLISRREGKNTYYSLKHKQLMEVIRMLEECQDC